MPKFHDLTGQRFYKVVVLERIGNFEGESGDSRTQWLCQCDCGMTVNFVARTLKRSKYATCYQCSIKHQVQYSYQRSPNGFMIRTAISDKE